MSPKKPLNKGKFQKRKFTNQNSSSIALSKNATASEKKLLTLQASKIPEITLNLALHENLSYEVRYLMAIKYLHYPTMKVSPELKYLAYDRFLTIEFTSDQKHVLTETSKSLQKELILFLMNNFESSEPEFRYLQANRHNETESDLEESATTIPIAFSRKLKKTWINTLVCLQFLDERGISTQATEYQQKNQIWLNQFAIKYPQLEVATLKILPIVDYHLYLFQQAMFLLLLTRNLNLVTELFESTRSLVAQLSNFQRVKLEEIDKMRNAELERLRAITVERETRKKQEELDRDSSNLSRFKIESLKSLASSIYVGAPNEDGYLDNGYSWGVLQKNIYSEFCRKVTAKILNHYGRSNKGLSLIHRFESENGKGEFEIFIKSLGCQDYRGNLRRYVQFPSELFKTDNLSLKDSKDNYRAWSSTNRSSVLSAERGNIPPEIQPFLLGWNTVANYFDEHRIFFLDNLGLKCAYSDFVLGIHIAFVAAKHDDHGLRGQWLLTLAGVPPRFSEGLEIMGWENLSNSQYREQARFRELLSSGRTYWLLETRDSSTAKNELGKLIEGFLFEIYGLTPIGSSSYYREVPVDIRRTRQKLLDLINRIRHYRQAVRYRPYLDYCANPSCGLPLSDPASLARGYGPICWDKISKEGVKHRDLTTDYDRLYYETPVSIQNWQLSMIAFFAELGLTT